MADINEKTDNTVSISQDLVERTLAILLSIQAGQVYLLIKEWDEAIPGLIRPTEG
jgi:hypothetical protein